MMWHLLHKKGKKKKKGKPGKQKAFVPNPPSLPPPCLHRPERSSPIGAPFADHCTDSRSISDRPCSLNLLYYIILWSLYFVFAGFCCVFVRELYKIVFHGISQHANEIDFNYYGSDVIARSCYFISLQWGRIFVNCKKLLLVRIFER